MGATVPVGVVVPTVAERHELLNEALGSVLAQTVEPAWVVPMLDADRRGPSWTRNMAAAFLPSSVEWVAPLDDDDVWYPDHLETLLDHADGADVVYTRARIVGQPGWDPQRFPFPHARMRTVNSLPCTGLIRRDLLVAAGGWPPEDESPRGYEDWGLWLRLMDLGARFVGVDRVTWEYRRTTPRSRSKANL